jgi:hypothetical protein
MQLDTDAPTAARRRAVPGDAAAARSRARSQILYIDVTYCDV